MREVKAFDRKFGKEFLESLPECPAVYQWIDESGTVIYVGKAKSLRRRIAQYRNVRRRKKDRKMKSIVAEAVSLRWKEMPSDLDACLEEVRTIQELRPRLNVATAFEFLYPLVGLRQTERLLLFCFTTLPDRFPDYRFHGAFRSRETTGEAFFALMRVLEYVGHRAPKKELGEDAQAEYSYVFGFRRLPQSWHALWESFFRGESSEALEALVFKLLENAGARKSAAAVQEAVDCLESFFKKEAKALRDAIHATGYESYPVLQKERDLLFLRYRSREEPA